MPRSTGVIFLLLCACAAAAALSPVAATAGPNEDSQTCSKSSGDTAIAACTRALATGRWKPHDRALILENRGIEYAAKGELDRAMADYSEAIRLDPKRAKGYLARGVAHYKRQDYDRAITDYDQAIRLDPKYADAFTDRGNAYHKKKDSDRALADHTQAIRLNPKLALAYYNRGLLYGEKDELDRALGDYAEAIRLEPQYANAFLNRCWTRGVMGRELPQALTDCDQAVRLLPTTPRRSRTAVSCWASSAGSTTRSPTMTRRSSASRSGRSRSTAAASRGATRAMRQFPKPTSRPPRRSKPISPKSTRATVGSNLPSEGLPSKGAAIPVPLICAANATNAR